MPVINDYKCYCCGYLDRDRVEKPSTCPNCNTDDGMQVTFQNWTKLEFNQYSENDRVDSKGYIRKFSALDDPICAAQLGMGTEQLQSYNRLSSEESTEFRQKLISNGDSPKLRREILAKYNEKVGNKYELQD